MNSGPTDLNRQIDLLVDDALDAPTRRALLARLDAEPGGWRRCALAFLEVQAWRADLQSTFETDRMPLRSRRRKPVAVVGMAAGLLVAFALGWSARGGAAPTAVASSRQAGDSKLVHSVAQAEPQRELDALETFSPLDAPPPDSLEPDESARWREAARRLQQHGYEVEPPQHRMIAVELRDGRRVTVPVEEMRIQYVGHQTF